MSLAAKTNIVSLKQLLHLAWGHGYARMPCEIERLKSRTRPKYGAVREYIVLAIAIAFCVLLAGAVIAQGKCRFTELPK
jgi:hypothetical protein